MQNLGWSSLVILIIAWFAFGQPTSEFFMSLRSPASTSDEGFKGLVGKYNSEKQSAVKAKMAFGLGMIAYKNGKSGTAVEYFNQALLLGTNLSDYAQYHLGLIDRDYKNFASARRHLEYVVDMQPTSPLAVEAEVEIARMARTQENWNDSFNHLSHLEKKLKHDSDFPSVLYDLVEAALNQKRQPDACRAAVTLYSRFPGFTLTKGWGANLTQVKISGMGLTCAVNYRDRDRRISHLINQGEFEEVRNELKDWQTKSRADTKTTREESGIIEQLQGRLALSERKVKEAIEHFQRAQEILGHNFVNQVLLARALSQTDDYGAAVINYQKAYEMSPRSRLGQQALFQAAFLSYQTMDYDGAARRFEELIWHSRASSLVGEARWHLAWMRYLKQDYDGAVREFTDLAKNKYFATSPANAEKIMYWRAMAELKRGNIDQARTLFSQLSVNRRLGYYTGAAAARLAVLPTAPVMIAAPPSPTSTPTQPPPANSAPPPKSADTADRGPANVEDDTSGEKDLEKLGNEFVGDEEQGGEFEIPPSSSVRDPQVAFRFERAKDLIDLGFENWARLELREIERRPMSQASMQTLMLDYARVGDFFHSSYLAEVAFEPQRVKAGIDGALSLWQYAYPQAYSKLVQTSAKKFDVSPYLIWSVMRGESVFRENAPSPAGALGLMQLIPVTAKRVAKDVGIKDFAAEMLLNPETNVILGTRYLKRLSKTMEGSLPLVIASYNAGPHRVQGWLKDFGNTEMDEFVEHIPYQETRNYVKKVLKNYLVYQTLYEKKSNPLAFVAQKIPVKYDGPKPTSESWDD